MKKKSVAAALVYSTEHGRMCPKCNRPKDVCRCRNQQTSQPFGDGIVRISRETKGRKGKGVTVIRGLDLDALQLAALGKELKKRCGTGGTVKGGIIEIQGDHRQSLLADLKSRGLKVKLAGG